MRSSTSPVDQADTPHDEAQQFLDRMRQNTASETEPAERRRQAQRDRSLSSTDPESVAAVQDIIVRGKGHGLPLRIYKPEGDNLFPVLVWAHGGGFTLGDIDTEDETARAITNETDRIVVSVDYRKAPEHTFPAALEDLYRAVEWTCSNIAEYGGDPDHVAVGGQSAGATLAAATALYARDHDGPILDHQVLVVPVVSYLDVNGEVDTGDGELPDSDYLDHPLHGYNPYAFPLEESNFRNLPPATILTAGFDERRHQGKAYAERLINDGVTVNHHHYPDTIHYFFIHFGSREWERAREALKDIAADLGT